MTPFFRTRLERMVLFLRIYKRRGYEGWEEASLEAAELLDKGSWLAKCLREWCRAFADDGTLPTRRQNMEPRTSKLEDEGVAERIRLFLQQHKYASAKAIAQHLSTSEPTIIIHERTVERWLHDLGFSWRDEPKGLYKDGHEREDVVEYRQNVFLPAWRRLRDNLTVFSDDRCIGSEPIGQSLIVVWFHDETTFYANDRRTLRWVGADEEPRPYPKGEGPSLMIADFVSADYGWLRSPDG